MTALRHGDQTVRIANRKTGWLPALEKELKSRVGWADEAVSPFAAKCRAGLAEAKIRHAPLRAEKAA